MQPRIILGAVCLVTGILSVSVAPAQTPTLVKDINTTQAANPDGGISPLVQVGTSSFFFSARNDLTGIELYTTLGIAGPTAANLVKDIRPGPFSSNPDYLYDWNGTCYFSADDGTNGVELWKSDGTTLGTVMVKDIVAGAGSGAPSDFAGLGSSLYFTVDTKKGGGGLGVPAYVAGTDLWKTDGTTAGTVLVKQLPGGRTSGLTVFGGALYFGADDNTGSGVELWKSDGTAAGTQMLKDINAGAGDSVPSSFIIFKGALWFVATDATSGAELWTSDGTAAGTSQVLDIRGGAGSSGIANFTVVGSLLFFSANDGAVGIELWKTDGTVAGTTLVQDIRTGTASTSSSPTDLIDFGGTLYFQAWGLNGKELYKSDGTSAGTVEVLDINGPGATVHSTPAELTVSGSAFYFRANQAGTGMELWRSDGTAAGTTLVVDTYPGTGHGSPQKITKGGLVPLILVINDGVVGWELFVSDGTAAGTNLLKDINPLVPGNSVDSCSAPFSIVDAAGTAYFAADDGVNGLEPWKSDGTSAGTVLVKDIQPGAGSSSPAEFTLVGSTVFFSANDGTNGIELWKTDGTASGTTLVLDIYPGVSNSNPTFLVAAGSTLFFRANDGVNGFELWKSDGTASGTVMVKDINASAGSNSIVTSSPPIVALGNLVIVRATDGTGYHPWVSDGTSSGTVKLQAVTMHNASFTMARAGGLVFFSATDTNGYELWKSDGTPAGTVMVKDINPGAGSSLPNYLYGVGKTLYFRADDGSGVGSELYKSDGTSSGTQLVKDINPGSASSNLFNMASFGNTLIFRAQDVAAGTELWKSDGTAAGTVMVKDIWPGDGHSLLSGLVGVGSRQGFFTATDGVHGQELWRTDGTTAGTYMVTDLRAGELDSWPVNQPRLAVSGGKLLFSADDGKYGNELWVLDPGAVAQEVGQFHGAPGMRLYGTDPVQGANMGFFLENAVPSSSGFFMLSLAPAKPTDLGQGLIAYIDLMMPPVLLGIGTNAQGLWSWTNIPVPAGPALKGILIATQAAVGPTTTPPLNTDASNGLFISLGN